MKTQPQRPNLDIPHEVPQGFAYTPASGWTDEEAASRKPNVTTAQEGKTPLQILLSNALTLFNFLNLALAVCLALVGSWRNMLFMGVVISNTAIGTFQELRARRTIQRLKLLSSPMAQVIRNGQERTCRPEELVEGDLVVLRAGHQVMADALVISGRSAADESLLTGESDAVRKMAGDWLMSGSYITEGECIAQLVYEGDDSYAARLTRSAREIKRPKSALMTDLNKLIRLVSVILVPLGILLFVRQYFLEGAALNQAVPSSVAAMIGMIPEGLMLLTSVAMMAGVVTLGRHKTLVQELYGIETLARADVLCLDKTGTLTTGRMQVAQMVQGDVSPEEAKAAMADFCGAFGKSGNSTLAAIAQYVTPTEKPVAALLPFSSQRKKSAVTFQDGTTLVLGALSYVLGDQAPEDLRFKAETMAVHGQRVLVLGRSHLPVTEDDAPVPEEILALIGIEDEIRLNARETLRYFDEQGVTLKVISGDDPRTVAAVAQQVELPGWDAWVDASALSEDELKNACEKYTIFGRVTPQRKRQLVEALKACGHSVAMTGDGVNDIPALKAADCSIAMAGGSDAAKHASQLTLLDSDFAGMPRIVGEGRRVIGNITRAASLFLVKTLYSFGLAVLMLILPGGYPFQPIQLTLISSLTVGAPSFFLALEPNRARIQGNFLQTVLLRAVPGALAVTVCAALAVTGRFLFGWPQEVAATLATLSAAVVGLMMLWRVCQPLTKLRAAVMICAAVAMVGAVLVLGEVFLLVTLDQKQMLAMLVLTALAVSVMLLSTWGMKALTDRFTRKGGAAAQG